jgi:hypothetical protein
MVLRRLASTARKEVPMLPLVFISGLAAVAGVFYELVVSWR